MNSSTRLRQCFVLALSTSALAGPTACSESNERDALRDEPRVGPLYIRLVDEPDDNIVAAITTVEGVDIRPCDGGGWISLSVAPALTVDLLSLQHGKFAQLLDGADVDTGAYCEIRLVLQDDSAMLELQDGSHAVAKIPSGMSSGLKLKGEFSVYHEVATRLVLDFPVAESFHPTGEGKWQMHPVLRIEAVDYVSKFHEANAEAPLDPKLTDADVTVSEITVVPEQSATLHLPDGMSIWFPENSVHRPITFTATTAVHRSGAASEGGVIDISPSFNFFEYPEIHMPDYPRVGPSAIVADTEALTTSLVDGELRALTPHFTEFCRDPLFPDSNPDHWYYSYVRALSCRGIVSGRTADDGTVLYAPNEQVTRAELLKLVLEASNASLDLPADPGQPFTDVPEDHWAIGYISWAKDAGLVSGYGDGSFGPDDPVTRAQAAKIIVEAGLLDGARPAYESLANSLAWAQAQGKPYTAEFGDLQWTSDCGTEAPSDYCWAYDYVYVLKGAGIVDGVGGLVHPDQSLTRAEAAKIVCVSTFGAELCRKHSDLTVSGECENKLDGLGIEWTPWPYITEYEGDKACTVEDPVLISSQTINGIVYEYPNRSVLKLSCKLAIALHDFAESARTSSDMYHIVRIKDAGTFNCRTVSGSTALSNHSFGNAIDIKEIEMSNGETYSVSSDWEKGVTPATTPKGQVLENLVEIMANNQIFDTILTPEYNAAHNDHFHVDVNGGNRYVK